MFVELSKEGFSSVQFSRSVVSDSATPWIAPRQASLSITNSRSSLRLRSIELVMPSSHLILCHPLLLLPPIPPSIRVFSNESALRMRWPKYWSFSFSIIPSEEHPGLISFRMAYYFIIFFWIAYNFDTWKLPYRFLRTISYFINLQQLVHTNWWSKYFNLPTCLISKGNGHLVHCINV